MVVKYEDRWEKRTKDRAQRVTSAQGGGEKQALCKGGQKRQRESFQRPRIERCYRI